jgi:hypothetical protein
VGVKVPNCIDVGINYKGMAKDVQLARALARWQI